MLEKCLIHIGVHKTGTTQIQKFLNSNTTELGNHNVLAPKLKLLHNEFTYKFIYQNKPGGKDWLNQLSSSKKCMILSDEDIIGKYDKCKDGRIYPNKMVYLNRVISLIPQDTSIDILLSVREYSEWLESSYLQWIKKVHNSSILPFDQYISRIDIGKLDWFNFIAEISSIKRISKIFFLPYEIYRKDNESLYSFLASYLGCKLTSVDSVSNSNVSYSAIAYDILMAAQDLENNDFEQLKRFVIKQFPAELKYVKPKFFSDYIRQIIHDKYINDLDKIRFNNTLKTKCL